MDILFFLIPQQSIKVYPPATHRIQAFQLESTAVVARGITQIEFDLILKTQGVPAFHSQYEERLTQAFLESTESEYQCRVRLYMSALENVEIFFTLKFQKKHSASWKNERGHQKSDLRHLGNVAD